MGLFTDRLLSFSWLVLYGAEIVSTLSFHLDFSSKLKKEEAIGVPGTPIRSVPTLMGEWINTHTPLYY